MPDLLTRTEHEDRVALLIYFYLDEAEATLRAGETVNWLNWSANLGRELTPVLAAVYLEAAEQLVGEHGGKLRDPEQRAREWAARRANWMAGAMATTTQQAVAAGVQAGTDLDDLSYVFSKERADAAGVTETTESISWGEVFAAAELARIGRLLVPYWQIEDEDACPVCKDRNGKPTNGLNPPAHPVCRCRVLWRVP